VYLKAEIGRDEHRNVTSHVAEPCLNENFYGTKINNNKILTDRSSTFHMCCYGYFKSTGLPKSSAYRLSHWPTRQVQFPFVNHTAASKKNV
jgi:hypothetical protein